MKFLLLRVGILQFFVLLSVLSLSCASAFSEDLGGVANIPTSASTLSPSLDKGAGMANPAAIYCRDLGYDYKIVNEAKGQKGICVFSKDEECEEWQFLQGKCGEKYSYCALQGFRQKVKSDGQNSLSKDYAVCVGSEKNEVGAVSELLNLSARATVGIAEIEKDASKGTLLFSPNKSNPAVFDWRNPYGTEENWMSPVKNQAWCGSCWAFSALGAVEAAYNIASGDPNLDADLSEQELVSCSPAGDCLDGGYKHEALAYVKNNGILDEYCFSYSAVDANGCDADSCELAPRSCSQKCSDLLSTKITDFGYVDWTAGREYIKTALLTKGPLSASIVMGSEGGGYFDANDIYHCSNDKNGDVSKGYTNHAVVVAGYDETEGYWIIKNSWGTGYWSSEDYFSSDGYFKLGFNECNVEKNLYYAEGLEFPISCAGGDSLSFFREVSSGGCNNQTDEECLGRGNVLGDITCCAENDCVAEEECYYAAGSGDVPHSVVDLNYDSKPDGFCENSSYTNDVSAWRDCDTNDIVCTSPNICGYEGAWVEKGEMFVGEYMFFWDSGPECCGDDFGEYLNTSPLDGTSACCNSANECVIGGECKGTITEEVCGDGKDNDCDGLTDECDACGCSGGLVCNTSTNECIGCMQNSDCNDGSHCTIDSCINPGTSLSYCSTEPTEPECSGLECGWDATYCHSCGTCNPSSQQCLSGECINNCWDGTEHGECNLEQQQCVDGILIQKDCRTCGCPAFKQCEHSSSGYYCAYGSVDCYKYPMHPLCQGAEEADNIR